MELIQVVKKIEDKINDLDQLRSQLTSKAQTKAIAIGEYDKALAMTILGLRNGESYELEAYKTHNPPVTVMEKIAKGLIWKKKLDMDIAESQYKNTLVKIEIVKAQMNSLQSINKNISHI